MEPRPETVKYRQIYEHPLFDAAAMRGEAKDAGDYLEEWRRADPVECGEDLPVEAQQVADQLVTDYPNERLKELIASGGHAAAPA